jgi:hypothetical protein
MPTPSGTSSRFATSATSSTCSWLGRIRSISGPLRFTVSSSPGAVPVYRAFGFVPMGEVASMHGISYRPMRREETLA